MQILSLHRFLYPFGAPEGYMFSIRYLDNLGNKKVARYYYDYIDYPNKEPIKLEQELWERTKAKENNNA